MKSILFKYPFVSFTVMAFVISWVMWLPVIFSGPEMPFWVGIFHILGGLGPLTASLLMISLSGDKEQLQLFKKSLFLWRLPVRWYLIVLLLPIGMVFAAYFVLVLMGETFQSIVVGLPSIWLYPLMLIFMGILGGGLEEPGWRGFALPKLLARYSPVKASLILGVIWACWHLPLFLAPSLAQSNIPVGLFILTGIALSVIFAWSYLATGGSILITIILHAGINAALNWYPLKVSNVEPFLPITIVAILTAVLLIFCSPYLRGPGVRDPGA